MHYTATASYMHRHPPSYARIHSDARAETPRHRRDTTPAQYVSPPGHHHHHHHPQPWHQMAHTYAWVDDHNDHFVGREKQIRKTEQWVLEQQIYFNHTHPRSPALAKTQTQTQTQRTWGGAVYTYDVEADEWGRREAEIHRKVMQREIERAKIVQEELRRTEERIRTKRETERQKMAVEKREREKRERARLERAMIEAWTGYETRWAAMQASSDTLTFSAIPWPLLSPPNGPEKMSPAGIARFLLSSLHSHSQTRKERIRSAQLRWHPDRFRRFMGRVAEAEKPKVEEAVGIVARCLNDL